MTEQLSQLEQQQQALLHQIKPLSARASEPMQKALAEIEKMPGHASVTWGHPPVKLLMPSITTGCAVASKPKAHVTFPPTKANACMVP